jgi:sugar transferase (PEP-CTERM/EpsH1 system associated)
MRVLFLTHRLPFAPNRGDRIRAYYLLREMSTFADVSLFSLVHDEEERERAAGMPFVSRIETASVPRLANLTRGALSLTTSRPLTHALLDAPDAPGILAKMVHTVRPDLVMAYCTGMARFALESPLAEMPCVLDMVDVDSAKWAELAPKARQPRSWIYRREARTLSDFEIRAAERAQTVTVVTAREREALAAMTPRANIHVLPNGVDCSAFVNSGPPSERPIVVFTGMMDYEPNVEAVTWFVEHVWPTVRAERRDARFTIVGANPTAAVQALANRDSSIVVTGPVDSVAPRLWEAAVSIAPLRVARGVQNKVLEALAAGLPTVVTSTVASGLPAHVERGCLVADDPAAFARAVSSLLQRTPEARRAMAHDARVEELGWERQLGGLEGLLTQALFRFHSVTEK